MTAEPSWSVSICRARDLVSGKEARSEFDLSKGVRGKYAAPYAGGTNVVVLELFHVRPVEVEVGGKKLGPMVLAAVRSGGQASGDNVAVLVFKRMA
jgi:hypothetical protein